MKYAIELAQADKRITPEENIFINELFNEWTETSIDSRHDSFTCHWFFRSICPLNRFFTEPAQSAEL